MPGTQIYGELYRSQFERLAADPVAGCTNRFHWNTTEGRAKYDTGAAFRAFLANDGVCVIGNHASAGNNIRLHRGATSLLQFVLGSDATAEGTLSTNIAQTSSRVEGYATGSLPVTAAANAGRLLWDTTLKHLKVDDGTAIRDLSPLTTKGDIYIFSTQFDRLPAGSNGQLLAADSTQPAGVKWATTAPSAPPTIQKFTSTGSTTGYRFTITSGSATAGATYTNNGNTYTVLATIASQTTLFCSQASAPQASGTLTKSSGIGDATIAFSVAVALATYTPAANVLYIRVKMVGGGGGGGGGGGAGAGTGGTGGTTTFGSNLLVANGGTGGTNAASSVNGNGAGGSASLGSGPIGTALSGGNGGPANSNNTGDISMGSFGASSPFGGAGNPAANTSGGGSAIANTGSGGGGAGGPAASYSGCGGGAGGFIDALISAPAATYPYVIATAGTGGNAGSGSGAGGGGGSGYIEVTEYYQ